MRRPDSPEQDEVPTIAVTSIAINGEAPPPVFDAISERAYDVAVTFTIANAPSQTKALDLQTVSSWREDHYQFPRGTFTLDGGHGEVTVQGTMLFSYSQAEGSQPLSVKLLASIVNEKGESTIISMLGRHELSFRVHRDIERFRARGPAASQAVDRLRVEIEALVPAERDHNRGDELEVAQALVSLMDRELRNPSFKGTESEKEFEKQLKHDLDIVFYERDDVYTQIKTGAGFVDCLVLGVPVELKVLTDGELEEVISSSLPQATQYVVTQSRRVGFLMILDCTSRDTPTPPLANDVQVRRGVNDEGLDPVADGVVAVGILIVRAQTTYPSRLRAAEPASGDATAGSPDTPESST